MGEDDRARYKGHWTKTLVISLHDLTFIIWWMHPEYLVIA